MYDIAIVGGGASGLALAHALLESPLCNLSILVIERDPTDDNQRTFSYWSDRPTPFDDLVERSWSRLLVAGPGLERELALGAYRYHTIRGLQLLTHLRATIHAAPRAEWRAGTVTRIDDADDHATITVNGARIEARWVFDSRFQHAKLQVDPHRHHALRQVFTGWEIETDEDAFDPDRATLFDFRTAQEGELRFFYVLPFSPRRAIVEHVRMRPGREGGTIERYLREVLGVRGPYRVIGTEGGTSPLTDAPLPRRLGRRVMSIGRLGGRIKPSSGYAWTRILDDSAGIVRSLEAHGHPFDVPHGASRYRFFDSVMLQVMKRRGGRMAWIFTEMFRRNPAERIFHFLDERASPAELALLVASIPFGTMAWGAMRLGLVRAHAPREV